MNKLKEYLSLIRIKHSLKNVLIFLPIIFSKNIFNMNMLITTILAFLSFTCASSFVYIFNDYNDIEKDRKHSIKRNRPLAKGTISKKSAIALAISLIVFVYLIDFILFLTNTLTINQFIISMLLESVYMLLNIGYSLGLKNLPIIDIVILVYGYVIRVFYGAAVTGIAISNWLYLTVISISFYMGLGKRRNEIKKEGDKSREVLKRYSKDFLDKNMYVFLTLSIVFYSLWCIDISTLQSGIFNNLMLWTVPIIMILLMKYSLDIEGDSYGDPIDVILKDKALITIGVIYVAIVFFILYLR